MNTTIRNLNENTHLLSVDYRDFWKSYLKENGYKYVLWINFDAFEEYTDEVGHRYKVNKNLIDLKEKLGLEVTEDEFYRNLFHDNTLFFVYDTLEALWEAFRKVDDEFDFYYVMMIREGEIVNENT
jgi:hypothetical protein